MEGIINVKDFGAAGNGCNDDTQAIRNAIDALIRPLNPPTEQRVETEEPMWDPYPAAVYFPAEVYRITDEITIPFLR